MLTELDSAHVGREGLVPGAISGEEGDGDRVDIALLLD